MSLKSAVGLGTIGILCAHLSIAAQPKPIEIANARFQKTPQGYEAILLTPAPNRLRVVSTRNGDPFEAIVSGGILHSKHRNSYGHFIHIPNPDPRVIEVMTVAQRQDGTVRVCVLNNAPGSFTLKKVLTRGDTLVFQLARQALLKRPARSGPTCGN